MRTLLVDADWLVHTLAAAYQRQEHWEDDIITTYIDLGVAKDAFMDALADYTRATADDITDEAPDSRIVLCWSDASRRYFRHEIEPTYKGHRRHGTPPLGIRELREWANEKYGGITVPGLEADDIIGIAATGYGLLERERGGDILDRVIVSVDKDLRQIPGDHFNPMRPEDGVFTVDGKDRLRLLATQTLTGDTVDGFSGIPGVGAVTAAKLLKDCSFSDGAETWAHIVAAYTKHGLTEADAVRNFNLARILTSTTFDSKTLRPILWNPSASSAGRNQPEQKK